MGEIAQDQLLTDEAAETALETYEKWETKEAKVKEIIFETISPVTYYQISNEHTAASMWNKLKTMCEHKGAMAAADIHK
ncbi:hypothetical protein D9758_014149 [Tetrapyrgos nigripes]|uniref:Uncharacterized protein n=1 Tax=Tetrapyrgos nigripes TaxID=182062 RepID=A0A8H5CNF6_9AGAR|nr:hypothetical protein D9758_014149 [Tetrapyrgos nigripes]